MITSPREEKTAEMGDRCMCVWSDVVAYRAVADRALRCPFLGEGAFKACARDDITPVIIKFPSMRHLASSEQVLLLALR